MAAILLVHGAWHDERCWEYLVPELRSRGYDVHTLTLPGHWHKAVHPLKVSLGAYGKAICDAAAQIGAPLTLLGHSMGGMAISAAAERDPFLFDHLIYLAAFTPRPDGWVRAQSLSRRDGESILSGSVSVSYARLKMHIREEQARALFYHDVDQEVADEATRRLHVQSIRPVLEPLRVSVDRWGSVPRSYIECLQDRTISIGLQREMQATTGFRTRLSLDTSHSPFLSQPKLLADEIDGICAPKRPAPPVHPDRQAERKQVMEDQVALALQQTA